MAAVFIILDILFLKSRPSERRIDTLQPRNSLGAVLLSASVLGDCAGCPSMPLCASGGGPLIWCFQSAES